MVNALLRAMISPTLPPVIISDAITNVYIVMAVWIPVTVVSRSLATVAMAVFMTVVSIATTNWPAARVSSTTPGATAAPPASLAILGLDPDRPHQPNRSFQRRAAYSPHVARLAFGRRSRKQPPGRPPATPRRPLISLVAAQLC